MLKFTEEYREDCGLNRSYTMKNFRALHVAELLHIYVNLGYMPHEIKPA